MCVWEGGGGSSSSSAVEEKGVGEVEMAFTPWVLDPCQSSGSGRSHTGEFKGLTVHSLHNLGVGERVGRGTTAQLYPVLPWIYPCDHLGNSVLN